MILNIRNQKIFLCVRQVGGNWNEQTDGNLNTTRLIKIGFT